MRTKRLNKKSVMYVAGIVALSLFALGFTFLLGGGNRSLDLARAGGVTPTITPSAQTVSTAGSVSIQYTVSAAMNAGDTLTLNYNNGYSGTITTANTTINGVAPSNVTAPVAAGPSSDRVVITLANTVTAGGSLDLVLNGLTTPVTAGNYAFTLSTDTGDFGGNFQYVGEANVVEIRAFVPLRLAFSIRNAADTANTNVCDLGEASTTSVVECDYRLKVSTNASGGYTISMEADGDLTNGVYSMTNAAAGPTGSTITGGNELYGVLIDPGSITSSGTITTTPAYTTSATNVVNYTSTTPVNIIQSTGPNSSPLSGSDTVNTSLVTHKLAIDDNTPVGEYTQRITYKVTPTF
jgi:hypothetical protein